MKPTPDTHMSAEEMRAELYRQMAALLDYWRDLPAAELGRPEDESELQARMTGFLFSLLTIFDGGNVNLPSFDLAPSPHPDDERHSHANGEKAWMAIAINADVALHEIFPWELCAEKKAEQP